MAVINTEDESTTVQRVTSTSATFIPPRAKANTSDAEESCCYWKYPRCMCRRWCSCWRSIEVSAGLRGRRRCIYSPAESGAVLQRSISHCAAQSKGGNSPSVSLQGKLHLAEWDGLGDHGSLWASCDGEHHVHMLSLKSHGIKNEHKRHIPCLYCSKLMRIPC